MARKPKSPAGNVQPNLDPELLKRLKELTEGLAEDLSNIPGGFKPPSDAPVKPEPAEPNETHKDSVAKKEKGAAKGLWDRFIGAEVLRQVVALIEQQRRYNDILATRLAEALARIASLEEQLKVRHEH
ncbi:MAG: hypothetical protein IPJ48_15315 [Propionivibrio sp.]|uniref:Uncharacterized protein n=1 Tax=Candidatus Propionivibrio dominans TaxID=2954373 RepID=A0A9D7FEU0_9RHOO|nr:hypothetical protein [Candidatus Propionivibrio dominans]